MKASKLFRFSLLAFVFLVYSLSSVFSKLASTAPTLSFHFIIYILSVLVLLSAYAILWQKVLSFMPLNKAFIFKSVTILMILVVSALVFQEAITINNIIGAGFIMSGLGVLSWKE